MSQTPRSAFDFNPRRNPEDLLTVLRDFVADAPAGWAVYGRDDKPYAGRRFEYASGHRALLSLSLGHSFGRALLWETQINVPFSAGAEESHQGREVKDVKEWIESKDRTLTIPLRIAECKTYDAAFEMASKLDSGALYTLSYVLDIDDSMSTAAVLRHRLIVACGIGRKGE